MVIDTDALLNQLGFFEPGRTVVDIGCGVGYIPSYLVRCNRQVYYTGFDVSANNIKHCRALFNGPEFIFKLLNVQSDTYNPGGKINPCDMVLPLPDSSVDSVICHSLFTHLGTEAAATQYMSQIKRILRPGGFMWSTWFAAPPNTENDGTVRTVYSMEFIKRSLKEFDTFHEHGGETDGYHDQLYIASVLQ